MYSEPRTDAEVLEAVHAGEMALEQPDRSDDDALRRAAEAARVAGLSHDDLVDLGCPEVAAWLRRAPTA